MTYLMLLDWYHRYLFNSINDFVIKISVCHRSFFFSLLFFILVYLTIYLKYCFFHQQYLNISRFLPICFFKPSYFTIKKKNCAIFLLKKKLLLV